MTAEIVFLDDDPVLRIARYALERRLEDAWVRDFFLPERPDFAGLAAAADALSKVRDCRARLATQPAVLSHETVALVFRRGKVDAGLMDQARGLRLVQRLGERPEGIDLAAARSRGIAVSCVPRRTLHYTAEHAILLMQALARQLRSSDRLVREGGYATSDIHPIDHVAYNWIGSSTSAGVYGKTLGIVGLGEVGAIVARLAGAFGMRVLYTKRHRLSEPDERALGVEHAPLATLLRASDIVSLHAGNTPENAGMADTAFFAAMKPGALFVNTTRGRLVDEDALHAALTSGHLAGAGLDVHCEEPRPPLDRFARMDNVVLTPHFAGGPRSGVLPELAVMLQNCAAVLRGEAPRYAL